MQSGEAAGIGAGAAAGAAIGQSMAVGMAPSGTGPDAAGDAARRGQPAEDPFALIGKLHGLLRARRSARRCSTPRRRR